MLDRLEIKIPKSIMLNDDELFDLCQENDQLHFERTKHRDIILMTPTGGDTSRKN